jgi:hypothetical protein
LSPTTPSWYKTYDDALNSLESDENPDFPKTLGDLIPDDGYDPPCTGYTHYYYKPAALGKKEPSVEDCTEFSCKCMTNEAQRLQCEADTLIDRMIYAESTNYSYHVVIGQPTFYGLLNAIPSLEIGVNETVNVKLSPMMSYNLINVHDTCNEDGPPTTCRLTCKRDQIIADCACRPPSIAPELIVSASVVGSGVKPVAVCTLSQMVDCSVNINNLRDCYAQCLPACVNTVIDMTLIERRERPLLSRERVEVDGQSDRTSAMLSKILKNFKKNAEPKHAKYRTRPPVDRRQNTIVRHRFH